MVFFSTGHAPRRTARKISACLLVAAILWAFFPSPPLASADDADDSYSLAAGLYKKQRWDLAAENFVKFLKKYPQHEKSASARLYGGLALVNVKDYRTARDLLREFVRTSPQNRNLAHAMYRVAECSYLLDDLKSAEADLSAFVTKFPEDQLVERALPYLGDVQLRMNRPEAAAKSFEKALESFPNGSMAEDSRFGLARTYESLKRYPAAIKLYEELAANREGARAAEAQLNLAARYFDDKDFAASADAYARLEERFPDSPFVAVAHLNHGFALYQSGDFRGAVEQFDAAAKDPKQAAEAGYWKGLSQKSLAEYPQAIETLQKTLAAYPDHALAESLLYHLADCEQRRGNLSTAQTRFLEVVKRFPASELADDALHYASVNALESGDEAATKALLDQFAKNYPRSGLRWHQEILRGRLDLLKNDPTSATSHFERALQGSESENTKSWARYYMGYAQHQAGKEKEALLNTDALAAAVDRTEGASPFATVFLLRGAAQLALAKGTSAAEEKRKLSDEAIESAMHYLQKKPQNELPDQAFALRAVAAVHSGRKDLAKQAIDQLKESSPTSPELPRTLQEMAEVAFANEDWEWAGALFGDLAATDKDSPLHASGLSGLGWTQFRRKRFAEAARTFSELAHDPSADKAVAAEASFMHGQSLQQGGQDREAAEVYRKVFQTYGDTKFGFLAGLQSARLLANQGQVAEADAAYSELLKAYVHPGDLDKVLDEWALLNYSARNYEKSDEIFRRLIKDAPQSDLVDNAKLSLAESALLNGKVDEARVQLQALEQSPTSDDAVRQSASYQLISIAAERKQWKEVAELCRVLNARFPEGKFRAYAEYHWAEADLNSQEAASAAERLKHVIAQGDNPQVRSEPWFPQAWILLAEAQFRLKQREAVAETVADFRRANPGSELTYLIEEVYGRSLKSQARFPEARAEFEKVINDPAGRRTETAAKSQLMIAETYLLEKDFETAEEEYLKVEILYKFPEWQAPALFQAAACQEQTNHWSEAVKSYESLIKQYPDNQYAAMAKERLPNARKRAGG